MNEDEDNSMTVSMAQKALTGVYGGATSASNAPNFETDAAKSEGQSLFRSAFGDNDPNKMPNGGGGSGGGGLVNQFVNPDAQIAATASRLGGSSRQTQTQRQRPNAANPALVSGASGNPTFAEIGRRDNILRSALVESLSRAGGFGGVGRAAGGAESGLAPNGATRQGQQQSQPVALTMARSALGGGKVPHYDYNGVSVALPDGVDANDRKAVAEAVAKQNEMIDMFNSIDDEDEEV